MKGKINGKGFSADTFAFDGCHKFYILTDEDRDAARLGGLGWEKKDLHPIVELPEVWIGSCPLRFIMSADLKESFVGQGEPARFEEGWDIAPALAEELELMAEEASGEWA